MKKYSAAVVAAKWQHFVGMLAHFGTAADTVSPHSSQGKLRAEVATVADRRPSWR